MSQNLNHTIRMWKDVRESLGRVEVRWRGITLTDDDRATFIEALVMAAIHLQDLSNQHCGFGQPREIVQWCHRMASLDVSEIASLLSDSISLWRRTSCPTVRREIGSFAAFKGQLGKSHPHVGMFLAPVKGAVQNHLDTGTAATFYPVYQFLSFLNHLTLSDLPQGEELEQEYLEREERLASQPLNRRLVKQMNSVMREWCSDFRAEDFHPKHGPGVVSDARGKSLEAKYRALKPDTLVSYAIQRVTGSSALSFLPEPPLPGSASRQSKIYFVPKSMKTKRVISAEPATLQYFQQGGDRAIRRMIDRSRYLSSRIDLSDQAKQGDMARRASRNRSHATVDLSAASDNITYDLVKAVFRGTALLPLLVALRSRTAKLPSGTVVKLAKFAPMGSALTFPIETLIFACITECAVRYVHYETGQNHADYRVYGDDIIVPEAVLQELLESFSYLGFEVNLSKTYGGSFAFRESCGCDAYDGIDVSPLRISRKFSAGRITSQSPDVFASLVSLANSARDYKLRLLRSYIVDKLLHDSSYLPPFSGDGRIGVSSPMSTNFHLLQRRNEAYHRDEYNAAMVRTCTAVSGDPVWVARRHAYTQPHGDAAYCNDGTRLFEWLRHADKRVASPQDPSASIRRGAWRFYSPAPLCDEATVVSKIGSSRTWLSKAWMPLYGLEVGQVAYKATAISPFHIVASTPCQASSGS